MGRTARTHRLTALGLKKYAHDASATAPLHDGGGLYLRKRGAALHWVLRLTDPATGAQQWHKLFPDNPLGSYPGKSLADARSEAKRLWSTRSAGVDPRSERRRRIEAERSSQEAARLAAARRLTVRQLFDRWAAIDLAPRTSADGRRVGRKDGGAFTLAQFKRRVFPELGNLAVEDVKRGDLLALLDAAKAEGKLRTANVLLSDLKQMFRFALTRDIVQRNPLDTISKREVGGTPVERERVLSPEELRMLAAALVESGLQPRYIFAVWIVLATGARVGELLGAAWADTHRRPSELKTAADKSGIKLGFVDLDRKTWHLPETKNQRDHTIHLSAFALEQFRRLAALKESEPGDLARAVAWVFPNMAATGPVGVKSLGKQLSDRQREPSRRLKGRTKATSALLLPGGRWTAHDLRRTAATLMAGLGVSGDVIDECLNHMIESRVRRTYIRDRRFLEQAKAFDALGSRLKALASPPVAVAPVAPQCRSERGKPHASERKVVGVAVEYELLSKADRPRDRSPSDPRH
jgi:integrase